MLYHKKLSDLVKTLAYFYQIHYPKSDKVWIKLNKFLLNKIFVPISKINLVYFRFEIPSKRKYKIRPYKKIAYWGQNITFIKIDGTCCLKIFELRRFRGDHQILEIGFENAPTLSQIHSMRHGECDEMGIWFLFIFRR